MSPCQTRVICGCPLRLVRVLQTRRHRWQWTPRRSTGAPVACLQLSGLLHLRLAQKSRTLPGRIQAGEHTHGGAISVSHYVESVSNGRWASFRHVNGVAVFREDYDANGEGGAMMVSTIVRAAPKSVWKVPALEMATSLCLAWHLLWPPLVW